MKLSDLNDEVLAREFAYRRIFKGLIQTLLEDKIIDFNFMSNLQCSDIEENKHDFFDMIVETKENYVYVVIKTGNIKDKQELYKMHYDAYKVFKDNHVISLHINLLYGDADKDYDVQKIKTDFGDSEYIFEIADINMDNLAFNYHEINGAPKDEELEYLRAMESKFVYKNEQ